MYGIINHAFNMLKLIPPLLATSAYQSHSQILNLRYQYLGVKHVCTPVAPVNIPNRNDLARKRSFSLASCKILQDAREKGLFLQILQESLARWFLLGSIIRRP